jgi:hypothetical protein
MIDHQLEHEETEGNKFFIFKYFLILTTVTEPLYHYHDANPAPETK